MHSSSLYESGSSQPVFCFLVVVSFLGGKEEHVIDLNICIPRAVVKQQSSKSDFDRTAVYTCKNEVSSCIYSYPI